MKVLIDDITKNHEAWIAQKRDTIGSGDIACIAGADKFRTPLKLWAVKTRREPPDPENDHMWFGRVMERPIAELCERKLDLEIQYANKLYGHDCVPFATATPDYFARQTHRSINPEIGEEPIGPVSILECKNVSYRSRQYWQDDTPLAPRIQVMWQMGITNIQQAIIAPLIGGDHEGFEARYVQFDSRIFDSLLALADKFMWHVKNDTPPPPSAAEDSKIIDKIWPVLDERTIELPEELAPEIETIKMMAAERKELESKARELEEAEKLTKNRIRLAMGGAKKAVCGPYSVGLSIINVKEKITKPYTYGRVTIKGGEDDAIQD